MQNKTMSSAWEDNITINYALTVWAKNHYKKNYLKSTHYYSAAEQESKTFVFALNSLEIVPNACISCLHYEIP